MFAADFEYYRAGSVAEAGQLLAAHPGAKLLAGGHSLIPLLKLRLAAPAAVIDIGRIAELRGISTDGDGLRIGALATHAEIAASDAVKEHAAALAEAAGQIGDPAVRNRGTIGGNVAHADPASDLPTVLAALGATVTVVGSGGERSIAVGDFFTGVMMTSLGENDLLTSIRVPSAAGRGTAYVKFSHPASRYAVIGVAVSLAVGTKGGGLMAKIKREPRKTVCSEAAVAVGGLVPKPVRCGAVEGGAQRPAAHGRDVRRRGRRGERGPRRRPARRRLRVGRVPQGGRAGVRPACDRSRGRAGRVGAGRLTAPYGPHLQGSKASVGTGTPRHALASRRDGGVATPSGGLRDSDEYRCRYAMGSHRPCPPGSNTVPGMRSHTHRPMPSFGG